MTPSSLLRRSLAALAVVLGSTAALAHQHEYLSVALNGASVVPPSASTATGSACMTFSGSTLRYRIELSGLVGTETAAEIRGYAAPGANAPVLYTLPLGSLKEGSIPIPVADRPALLASEMYVSIATSAFPGGEIRGQMIHQALIPWVSYCLGDGSAHPCPCSNEVLPGATSGCAHSAGQGAFLSGHGASTVLCDNFGVEVEGLPASSTVAGLIQGTTRANGGVGAPFGDGLMCIGGTQVRIGVLTASAGAAEFPAAGSKISALGNCSAGDVRTYQVWYRNPAAFCGPSGFNTTEGLEVTWLP